MSNLQLADHVREILKQNSVSCAPIPVMKIARSMGAQVRFSPLDDELSGMIFVSVDRLIIGVNSRHHLNRQRFTIAHEIAHLVLHRNKISDLVHVDRRFPVLMRDSNSATGMERLEIEANRFAAELLMPSSLITEMLKKQGFDIDDEKSLNRLATRFQVSRQALEFRIRSANYDSDDKNASFL